MKKIILIGGHPNPASRDQKYIAALKKGLQKIVKK